MPARWFALGSFAAVLALAAACTRAPAPVPVAVDAGAAPVPVPAPPPAPSPQPPPDAAPDVAEAAGADAGAKPAEPPARGAPARRPRASAPEPPSGGRGISGIGVAGSLPKSDATRVLRAGAGALRGCYEAERAKNPGLRGRVSFRLTIDDLGRVSFAEVVTSTLGGGGTEMCMARAMRQLKFPRSADGAEATVTFQMGFAP